MTQSYSKIDERSARFYMDVVETRNGSVSSAELEIYNKREGDILINCGLLVHNGASLVAAVADDDTDTPIGLEWLPEQNAYGYYSSESGYLSVDKNHLRSYRFDGLLFAERLVSKLDMLPGSKPRERIEEILWELGKLRFPKYKKVIVVWFARRLKDPSTLQYVDRFLKNLNSSDINVIVTTSPISDIDAEKLSLYHITDINDLLDHGYGLIIDPNILRDRIESIISSSNTSAGKRFFRIDIGVVVGIIGLVITFLFGINSPNDINDYIRSWKEVLENSIESQSPPCPLALPCASFRGP